MTEKCGNRFDRYPDIRCNRKPGHKGDHRAVDKGGATWSWREKPSLEVEQS
jgi:hypothetical protein